MSPMQISSPTTFKFLGLRAALFALALALSAGLNAQTAVSGSAGAAPAAAAPVAAAPGAEAGSAGGNAAAAVSPVQALQSQMAAANAAKAADAGDGAKIDALARPRPAAGGAQANQFQRFVQETTGRLLPVYGSKLFDAAQTYAADAALPAPDNYVLGPGDEVRLQVWGPVEFVSSLVLDRNGQVNLPKVGVVTLAGVAVRDLDMTLRAALGKVFTNFNASASMGRLRGIQVYVVGQALQPGSFHLSSLSTLVNALFASGGPNANGSMRNIELKRDGKTVSTIDLYDFIARGDKSHDLPLLSGDVIVIPPVGPRVAVTGAFDQAAIFELKTGATSVGDILALSGGVPALATAQKALLERITRDSNPPRQVQDLVLNEQGLRQTLRDGDVLTLLGISPAFANAVTLQGTVAAPLRYRWFEGMKILDLIPERDALITSDYYLRKNLLVQNSDAAKAAGGDVSGRVRSMSDQINWEYAVIERLDRNKLSTELIPFNLRKAVLERDPTQNLPLLAGDVVTILSQHDLRLPQDRQTRLVRVEGEVAAPGVYQTQPGETLVQLLQRIGGLTPQAYVFGAEFTRESVRLRQQDNLETLIRRLEAQSQSQSSSLTASLSAERAAQAPALLQQQQAQMKSQIDRLKTLKSNGRLALELDPQASTLAALPALPLEDGDRVLIPSVPGFVAAYGSVNNENALIYKPGKTVGDVIKTAGLTEDAELDQAFVLRADGSIIAKRDRNGLFGGGFESLPVMPGDTLVVPAQLDRESRYSFVTRAFKDWTQVLSNFGLGIAAFKSVGVL
jgi:protein involved in polysaccharide export with SLBB domain